MIDFTLRGEPEDINCPYCFKKQRVNIYEATEVFDEEGEFKMECEDCDKKFVVAYEYIPNVQTLTIDEEEKK